VLTFVFQRQVYAPCTLLARGDIDGITKTYTRFQELHDLSTRVSKPHEQRFVRRKGNYVFRLQDSILS